MTARRRVRGSAVGVAAALLVIGSACGSAGIAPPLASEAPESATPTSSPSPPITASPTDPTSPTSTASPTITVTPPGTPGAPTVGPPAPAACGGQSPPAVTPVRAQKVTPQARRTTEVVTVVSDGRSITPGAREQTDFTTPSLSAPDGSVVTDPQVVQAAADLVAAAAKTRVLLSRPEPPDAGLDASRPPLTTAGTYVLYSASTVLLADVVVRCGGTEQVWSFTAEGSPTTGQVNCAVEPARGNALARSVYAANC